MHSLNSRRVIGKWGEQIAADYLTERGYLIIGRNIRTPYGEIDILAKFNLNLIFIEVKTRTSSTFGFPEVSISPKKLAHMEQSALHYSTENEITGSWQLDVISVTKRNGASPEIIHFENVSS